MPTISPSDIASFAIANAAAGPEVARAFLLQGSLGANGPLIAAKLIADQVAVLQAQLAVKTASSANLSAAIASQTAERDQRERELSALTKERSALEAQNAASGDAAAIVAHLYRRADADDTQWAAKLKQVRAAIEKSDTDNDALHTLLFLNDPGSDSGWFMFKMMQGDDEVDPAVARDFQSFAEKLRSVSEQFEQRNTAARSGQYVPAETFTVEVSLSALGEPVPVSDPPASAPTAAPSSTPAHKRARTPNRTRK